MTNATGVADDEIGAIARKIKLTDVESQQKKSRRQSFAAGEAGDFSGSLDGHRRTGVNQRNVRFHIEIGRARIGPADPADSDAPFFGHAVESACAFTYI